MTVAILEMADNLADRLKDLSFEFTSNAAYLASFFAVASLTRSARPEFEAGIHRRLLQDTLKWASVASPFYRDTLRDLLGADGYIPASEFESIPIIARDDIVRNVDAIRNPSADFAFATFTSGTTSGEPLIIDRCESEQEYLHDFLRALSLSSPSKKVYGLRLETPWHGRTLEFAPDYHSVSVSLSTMSGLKTAHALLRRKYVSGGQEFAISAVGGGLVSLHRLTAYLERMADRESLPRVESLQSTSEYVTARTRRRLEGFWGVDLIDRFGVSELIAGAWRCAKCRRYHFEPYGYPEVISFGSGKPISRGVGRLVLTGYYPFMQVVPLVRYSTGDVVRLFEADRCPTLRPGIELLGRVGRSAMRAGTWLIGENELYDILDEYPFLQRNPFYQSFQGLEDAGAFPTFELKDDAGTMVLNVRRRQEASLTADDVTRFGDVVRSTLVERTGEKWRVELQ